MNDVAAIILAAGRSRRMGAFKPLLRFGDRTVIECVVGNFRAAGIEEIVIVVGHGGADVRLQLKSDPAAFVVNPNPDSEMSDSIALGLAAINSTARALLITPVDHPAVPTEVIDRLIQKWREGAKLVQPEFSGKGGHPVLIDLQYRQRLTKLKSQAGLRGLFDKYRSDVSRLPVTSPFVARDMDTWDDYVSLHEAVFGTKPGESGPFDHSKG